MKFKLWFYKAVVPATLLFALSSHASQVYVEPTTGSGISPSDLTAATELISTSVTEVSSNRVVEQAAQADLILRPKLIRLGEAYILSLTKTNKEGQILFSSQLKAEKIDELDKVAQRLTRSVLESETGKEGIRVGEITNEEAKEGTQRRPVRNATYFGFGGSTFSNLGSSGIGYNFGLAYSWDINRARIKILSEWNINGNSFFASGGLGANYFFTLTDLAPYIAADFGAGAAKLEAGGILSGQAIGGFVVGVGTGIEFFRTSAINLDLGFRAGFLLNSNTLGMPAVYSLRLGVYF